MIVGDEGLRTITITEDNMMEDYRVFVKRAETAEQGAAAANSLLFTLLQAQLIDQITFANLFNRATPSLVAEALRKYQIDKLAAQQKADQAANQGMVENQLQQQDMAQAGMQMMQEQQAAQQQQQDIAHQQEMQKIALKEISKNEREMMQPK
jgi:hypothetical protein